MAEATVEAAARVAKQAKAEDLAKAVVTEAGWAEVWVEAMEVGTAGTEATREETRAEARTVDAAAAADVRRQRGAYHTGFRTQR